MTRFFLDENGALWDNDCMIEAVMADTEQEAEWYSEFIEKAKGDVLIAGLGIRWANKILQEKESVTSIDTVEKHQEVIDLNPLPKNLNKPERIIKADIFDYVPDKTYDTIFIDLWNSGHEFPPMVNGVHPIDILIERLKPYLNEGGWIDKFRR